MLTIEEVKPYTEFIAHLHPGNQKKMDGLLLKISYIKNNLLNSLSYQFNTDSELDVFALNDTTVKSLIPNKEWTNFLELAVPYLDDSKLLTWQEAKVNDYQLRHSLNINLPLN